MPYKDPDVRKAKARERGRAWYLANLEHARARRKAWHAAHPNYSTPQMSRWRAANRDKARAYTRESVRRQRLKDPTMDRRAHLKCLYGITVEQFDAMLAEQGGACAICRKPPSGKGRGTMRLHVDHDHGTGKVRALLCIKCNRGIGCFDDNDDLLAAAIEYVRKHSAALGVTLAT